MKTIANKAPYELRSLNSAVEQIVYYDSLTQLPNRNAFMLALINLVSVDNVQEFNLLFVDLNRFTEVNNNPGYLADDKALIAVTKLFKNATNHEGTLARFGGDQFAFLIRGTETLALDIVVRLHQVLEKALSIEGDLYHISPCIAMARYPYDGNTAAELLHSADIAIQHAKGKQEGYGYSCKLLNSAIRRHRIGQRLKGAMNEELFHLLYQPTVILDNNQFCGAEVLLGWNDPDLGSVSLDEFIPIAEQLGVMPNIGQWVIKQSCLQLKKWIAAETPLPGRLSIKISTQQLEQETFIHELMNNVLSEGALPTDIELDVTESLLMKDQQKAEEKLCELNMLGFSVAIDEFRTGYSSLAYLEKNSERTLKIGHSYMVNIATNNHVKKLVKVIIDTANRLGITTVAEGVETAEQAELVKELGCKAAQGFYYAKPCSADQLTQVMNWDNTISKKVATLDFKFAGSSCITGN